jgi:hypothetical protein
MLRMLLMALNLEHIVLASAFETLKRWGASNQHLHGTSVTHFVNGRGEAGANRQRSLTAAEFVQSRNGGGFSPGTLRQSGCDANWHPGFFMEDLINLMVCGLEAKVASTWTPVPGKIVLPGSIKWDGMVIVQKLQAMQAAMALLGCASGPIAFPEGKALVDMDDEALQAWLVVHPLAAEMEEWMFTLACNSLSGHLGCFEKMNGGRWPDIDSRFRAALLALRVCLACLRRAFAQRHTWETAEEQCDSFCEDCELAQTLCGWCKAAGRKHWHYTRRICGGCSRKGEVCVHLWAGTGAIDQGGGQHALTNQVTRRNALSARGFDKEVLLDASVVHS